MDEEEVLLTTIWLAEVLAVWLGMDSVVMVEASAWILVERSFQKATRDG